MVGDGSYLMMNSDIYSSVLTGHKLIVVVCDNGGFAVINRLQNVKGVPSFNNLIEDCRHRAARSRSTSPSTPSRWVRIAEHGASSIGELEDGVRSAPRRPTAPPSS